jgi:hypothetical protein
MEDHMMVKSIELADDVFDELKTFAEPLVDDINSVIRKLIEAHKGKASKQANAVAPANQGLGGVMDFDPTSPPNLRHTTPTKIILGGKLFKPADTYWNTLLIEVIRRAADALPKKDVPNLVIVNHQTGERTDTGFRYIPEANLSVQGQDSVMAWKAIHHIAAQLGFPLEVEFRWQPKQDAAYPNGRGRMRLN